MSAEKAGIDFDGMFSGGCQEAGCDEPAERIVLVCIPPSGWPLSRLQIAPNFIAKNSKPWAPKHGNASPLVMAMSHGFCAGHGHDAKTLNEWPKILVDRNNPDTDPVRKVIEVITRNRQPPDFSRAGIGWVYLDGTQVLPDRWTGKVRI